MFNHNRIIANTTLQSPEFSVQKFHSTSNLQGWRDETFPSHPEAPRGQTLSPKKKCRELFRATFGRQDAYRWSTVIILKGIACVLPKLKANILSLMTNSDTKGTKGVTNT